MAEDLLWPTMAAAIPKILKSTYHSVQHKRKGDGADHSLQIILLFFLSPLRFLLFFYISAIPGFTVVLRHCLEARILVRDESSFQTQIIGSFDEDLASILYLQCPPPNAVFSHICVI